MMHGAHSVKQTQVCSMNYFSFLEQQRSKSATESESFSDIAGGKILSQFNPDEIVTQGPFQYHACMPPPCGPHKIPLEGGFLPQ